MQLFSGYEHLFSLGFLALLAIAMVLVVVLDVSLYVIPNNLNLAILVLYAFAAFLLHLPFLGAILAAALVLAIGLGIFALGLMGGGDVKLIAALTLWTGWTMQTANFLMLTAVMGGALVIVTLTLRALVSAFTTKNLPRFLTRKQPVPYGVAVAFAFGLMLAMGNVPGLPKPF